MSDHNFNVSDKKPFGFGLSFHALVAAGSIDYKRRIHLQRLLPVTMTIIDDGSVLNCKWIISQLAGALRHERNRGRKVHWTYSLNRHIALLQAYQGERRNLENLEMIKTKESSHQSARLNPAAPLASDGRKAGST